MHASAPPRGPHRRAFSKPLITGVPVDPRAPVPFLLLGYSALLARYHQHRVRHMDRLGALLHRGRRVVLVGNHVLDVADALLFVAALVSRYGRAPHFIGHENIIFQVPGLRELARSWGAIPSRHMDEAGDALGRDGLLMLFPGSGTEAALRRYREEPYRLKWQGRLGFLRLALDHDAEIVFVAAVGIEEMYYQSTLRIPDWMLGLFNAGDADRYHGTPISFGLLGPHLLPTIFPLPVQIVHDLSPAIDLGDREAARRDPQILAALQRRVWEECQAYLDRAVTRRDQAAPCLDRVVRGVERTMQRTGI
jgi:1-acyl-sn-glycerol-3-phosphate acyltransferase